jgi:hypothetical protein
MCLQVRPTWATEATHPALDAVMPGTVTFEWLEGDHFLLARSSNEHEFAQPVLRVLIWPSPPFTRKYGAVDIEAARLPAGGS